MRIIQISGKGRVGKSTLADLIGKYAFEMGYHVAMVPFAKAIKDQAKNIGITKESDSSAYREFCQKLGADKRAEDADYWVARTYETIQEYMVKEIDNKKTGKACWQYVIIQDDVRYMNELAFGRDLAALQIFVSSGGRELEEETAEWRTHESEILGNAVEADQKLEYAELFDLVINNNGSVQDMEDIVKTDLESWLSTGFLELEEYDDSNNSDH